MGDCAFCGRRGRDVVQDALAGITLDDAVVLPHKLKDLRAQAYVTDRTEPVTRGAADRDAFSDPRDLFEQRKEARFQTGQQRRSRLRRLGQRCFLDSQFAGEGGLLGADFFLLRREDGLVLLHLGRDDVRFDHPLEYLFFDRADVALRGLGLVLDGLILAVGLDRRLLV